MPSRQHNRAARRREQRDDDRSKRNVASTASARFTRVPARKAQYVADLIRGMTVSEAQIALKLTHRPSAVPVVERLLKSAVSNVDKADHPEVGQLVIGRIWIDTAGMQKRFRPRAYGRAARIRKRMSHISMELIADAQ